MIHWVLVNSEDLDVLGEIVSDTFSHNVTYRFTSIRIVNAHRKVIIVRRRFQSKNNSVPTDAKVSIAQLLRLLRSQGRFGSIAIVNQNKVVSKSFVLGKCDFFSKTMSAAAFCAAAVGGRNHPC